MMRILVIACALLSQCQCARILYVTTFTSKSHIIVLQPLGIELARRGHDVTVLTPYPIDNPPPNYKQIRADNTTIWEGLKGGRPNVFHMTEKSLPEFFNYVLWQGGIASTTIALNSPEIQQFLSQKHEFDLVIAEQFYQEAFYTLAYMYKAPLVLTQTLSYSARHNYLIGNPLQLSTLSAELVSVDMPMNFFGRLKNFYLIAYEYIWWRYWYLPQQEELVDKYIPGLPKDRPSLIELQKDVALTFYNGHFTFDGSLARLPHVIDIGGQHLKESDKELPNDLKRILDSATDGAIYMSFGSNVRSTELPVEMRDAFINVFRRLNQTVLWKWEDDTLQNIPKNVVLRKWMPQQQILAHPNVKIFISHAGLIGIQETIYYGVPVIGVPIYADQYNNILQAEERGFGKLLNFKYITEENVESVIMEVLNESYRKNAKEMSKRFKDRPMSAIDTAAFWVEYVIRNNGAEYMRNPSRNFDFIRYNMLDVYAFIVLCVTFVLYSVYKITVFVFSIGSNQRSKSKSE